MSKELTELTDRVLKEVIKNQVILPSTYKEHFENHAREMQIDLDYEDMVSKTTQNRLDEANALMEKSNCNLDELEKTTADAKVAIQAQDLEKLSLVVKEIESLKDSLASLKSQLHTDTLTKVYNRKWLMENLLSDGKFKDNGVLVFIDLDKFKTINDEHGHIIGDKVLQYIASYLRSNLKDSHVIRYAGDEFLVVSPEHDMAHCFARLKALQENLLSKKLKASNGDLLHLAFSYGLTHYSKGADFRDVLEIADSLMYENKKRDETS